VKVSKDHSKPGNRAHIEMRKMKPQSYRRWETVERTTWDQEKDRAQSAIQPPLGPGEKGKSEQIKKFYNPPQISGGGQLHRSKKHPSWSPQNEKRTQLSAKRAARSNHFNLPTVFSPPSHTTKTMPTHPPHHNAATLPRASTARRLARLVGRADKPPPRHRLPRAHLRYAFHAVP